MSCLNADVQIVNGCFCACVERAGGLSIDCSVIKKAKAKIRLIVKPISDLGVNIDFAYAKLLASVSNCNVPIFVKIDDFCGQIIPSVYLEIEPDLLWVYPDWEVENYVYSNTDWFVN